MLEMRSIDVEAKGGVYGRTCLHAAAQNDHLAICRLLIDKGAQLEAKDGEDMTPLYLAARHGCVQIVRLLCDRGADVEARDNYGRRPIHWAASNGHISVVKELIEERNADINARINGGWTALVLVRIYDKPDVAAYLISRGGLDLGVFENENDDDDLDFDDDDGDDHDNDNDDNDNDDN